MINSVLRGPFKLQCSHTSHGKTAGENWPQPVPALRLGVKVGKNAVVQNVEAIGHRCRVQCTKQQVNVHSVEQQLDDRDVGSSNGNDVLRLLQLLKLRNEGLEKVFMSQVARDHDNRINITAFEVHPKPVGPRYQHFPARIITHVLPAAHAGEGTQQAPRCAMYAPAAASSTGTVP